MADEYPDWQDEPVKVVRNHEGICSIWPAERNNAPGWYDVGFSGDKEACMAYVDEHCDDFCKLKGFTPNAEEVAFAQTKLPSDPMYKPGSSDAPGL